MRLSQSNSHFRTRRLVLFFSFSLCLSLSLLVCVTVCLCFSLSLSTSVSFCLSVSHSRNFYKFFPLSPVHKFKHHQSTLDSNQISPPSPLIVTNTNYHTHTHNFTKVPTKTPAHHLSPPPNLSKANIPPKQK